MKEIERELGVSRASVSVWVRNVQLGPEQRTRLIERARLGPIVSGERKAALFRESRQSLQATGRARAQIEDAGYAAGCMLYWAEGSKCRNSVHLTNADPNLCAFFLAFIRRYFGVPDSKVAVTCNLFADHVARQREIERHWLDLLDLPRSSLRKSTVNTYSKYGSIQEYGGFDRPEWLD